MSSTYKTPKSIKKAVKKLTKKGDKITKEKPAKVSSTKDSTVQGKSGKYKLAPTGAKKKKKSGLKSTIRTKGIIYRQDNEDTDETLDHVLKSKFKKGAKKVSIKNMSPAAKKRYQARLKARRNKK